MRYRLRTLLIVLALLPPIIAWAIFYPIPAAIAAVFVGVAALPRTSDYL
jgi:hypothetical protein